MSSGISSKTPVYGFNLINFDFPRWGSLDQENWRLLDSLLQSAGLSSGGIWRNSTDYAAGTRVVDNTDFRTYAAQVTHTSAASGTFAADRAANPTYWAQVVNAPLYRGLWATFTFYNYLDLVSFADGSTYICTTTHTSTGTFNAANWAQVGQAFPTTFDWTAIVNEPTDFQANFLTTVTNPPVHAQCQLNLVGANLLLSRFRGGKYLWINGKNETIPAAGVSLAPTGLITPQTTTNRAIASSVATLTFGSNSLPNGAFVGIRGVRGGASNIEGYAGAATLSGAGGTTISYPSHQGIVTDASAADATGSVFAVYYIYAFMSGGTMTLEASFTAYTIDATTGMPIKTGDATRTLVGMASIDTGPAWINTRLRQQVRSYFNRKPAIGQQAWTANRAVTSTSPVEINNEMRLDWLQWADECAHAIFDGTVSNSTAAAHNYCYLVIDNLFQYANGITNSPVAGNAYNGVAMGRLLEGNEGYHYAALWGQVTAGTATWAGNVPVITGQNSGGMDLRVS